jgi:hypothetical protein
VQIDGSTVRMANSRPFRHHCRRQEKVIASWKSKGVTVQLKLLVDRPGEEACFFRGWLSATKGRRRETHQVIGGCGC